MRIISFCQLFQGQGPAGGLYGYWPCVLAGDGLVAGPAGSSCACCHPGQESPGALEAALLLLEVG